MGRKCCVPKCTSDYLNDEKVVIFKGPSERKFKWELAIKRKDYKVSETSYVCEKHFDPDDIVFSKWLRKSDETKVLSKRPRLKPGAVPKILPGIIYIFESLHVKYVFDRSDN
jgi:hypothetical protein